MEKMDKSLSGVDKLKARVLMLKPLPPGHAGIFMKKFPEYNTKEGLDKYRNIVSTKCTDQEIIEKMEKVFRRKKTAKKIKS